MPAIRDTTTSLSSTFAALVNHRRGAGSPLSVVTPTAVGQMYVDTAATTGARVWISTGTTSASWVVAVGDTEWRSIAASGAGVIGGTIRTRRVGNMIQVNAEVATDASFVSGTTVYTASAGFSGIPSYLSPGYVGTQWHATGGTALKLAYTGANGGLRGTWVFTTTDAWPTSLPGTAG